jgi:predicted Rossmann fold flavoprotein
MPAEDIVVVGAGAAGLATAIFTRRLNPSRPVLLLDGAAKPGAKILVSGGSRCNVTNVAVTERDFSGGKSTIVRRVLRGFTVAETIAWFAALGVPLHEEEHGKLFPDSNRSRDVLDALLHESEASGVMLRPATRVADVAPVAGGFRVETSRGPIDAASVVLATGGLSLPKTGSDGAGLDLARRLGHAIVPTTPSLVPLVAGSSPGSCAAPCSGRTSA